MNPGSFKLLPVILFTALLTGWAVTADNWRSVALKKYTIYYTPADEDNNKEYIAMISKGLKDVESFFGAVYKNKFSVYVHPNRASLDSSWQKDWKMPDFRSECWMVASGVALRLDMISPKTWDKTSCEHKYSDTERTQQLINHELFHVFHGQMNASPDFSTAEGIDWFVEGLATYASGQCDTARISEIKKAIAGKRIPQGLDNFWTGNLKYGLSGSVVMYIDKKYGRAKLKELLPLNKKTEILQVLNSTEPELLTGWADYIMKL